MSLTQAATKAALRRLLRETAQPVAVVTSFYPFDAASVGEAKSVHDEKHNSQRKFHGATLSSFTSIALDPHPLVAFSLRIPSRMATSLKERLSAQRTSPSRPEPSERTPTSLVINLLSNTQADTAHHFARADLFPDPFRITPYSLNQDGLPVLNDALGALSCELVSCLPLHDICDAPAEAETTEGGVISELFISRVARVETLPSGSEALPLLYHHRRYATARPL